MTTATTPTWADIQAHLDAFDAKVKKRIEEAETRLHEQARHRRRTGYPIAVVGAVLVTVSLLALTRGWATALPALLPGVPMPATVLVGMAMVLCGLTIANPEPSFSAHFQRIQHEARAKQELRGSLHDPTRILPRLLAASIIGDLHGEDGRNVEVAVLTHVQAKIESHARTVTMTALDRDGRSRAVTLRWPRAVDTSGLPSGWPAQDVGPVVRVSEPL